MQYVELHMLSFVIDRNSGNLVAHNSQFQGLQHSWKPAEAAIFAAGHEPSGRAFV